MVFTDKINLLFKYIPTFFQINNLYEIVQERKACQALLDIAAVVGLTNNIRKKMYFHDPKYNCDAIYYSLTSLNKVKIKIMKNITSIYTDNLKTGK